MQLGLELINLTIPFYLIKILIGHTLYMVMSKNPFSSHARTTWRGSNHHHNHGF